MATIVVMTSRGADSYAGELLVGSLAIPFLLLRGHNVERFVLLLLLVLCTFAYGEQLGYGLRQVGFIAMFMIFARYLEITPWAVFFVYTAGLFLYIALQGDLSALFLVGLTMALLLAATEIEARAKLAARQLTSSESWRISLLTAISFAFPWIGSGSRTALVPWVAFSLQRLSLPIIITGALSSAVLLALPATTAETKLLDSVNELTQPIQDTGLISQRALESLVFLGWYETATPTELLIGSDEVILMPGDLIANQEDPPFIPHNQILGLIFQFGIVGFLAIGWYMYDIWRHQRNYKSGRILFFILLVPGFLTFQGFRTPDYAILAAVINCLIRRSGSVAR